MRPDALCSAFCTAYVSGAGKGSEAVLTENIEERDTGGARQPPLRNKRNTIRKKKRRAALCSAVLCAAVLLTAGAFIGRAPVTAEEAAECAASARREVRVCGRPVGIELSAGGVVIADMIDVLTSGGSVNPGETAGLQCGDVIRAVDGEALCSAVELTERVTGSGGRTLTLSVRGSADGGERTVELTPVYSTTDGCYRAGLWTSDTTSGIGILTFVEPESGRFGALGHAICDARTGAAVRAEEGQLTDAVLTGLRRGVSGRPGELTGCLGGERLGSVCANTGTGVCGLYTAGTSRDRLLPLLHRHEVREGAAQMLTTLPGGEPELYDVVIERISCDSGAPTRNMVVRVTDKRLLDEAGGIVQGMSGSPIIQNGALAAAVTHVFVGDPRRGYAIFAENMVNGADAAVETGEPLAPAA